MVRHYTDCGRGRRFAQVHADSADSSDVPGGRGPRRTRESSDAVYWADFVSCVHEPAAKPDIRDRAA
jgi:hypothetical protein